MFGRPSWSAGRGRETLLESHEELAGSPGRPGRARRDPKVMKRMGGPPRGLGGVERPCHTDRKCREAISKVRE